MRLLSTALIVVAFVPLLAQPGAGAGRLVAIGDIHGAYAEFTALLQRAGLVDGQLRWSGGRATLVQTGDYTDRGADVRKVLDLLMRLEREARSAGGRVVALAGNHEVMNMIGDWRDVTPEICAAFRTPQSEKHREEGWKQYERLRAGRAPASLPSVYQQSREEWLAAHPLGCLEYREAMGPRGAYGRWLRDKPIAAEVGGTLFMHAGINPARPAPRSIDEVVDRARAEIRRFDSYRQRLIDRRLALWTFTLQQVLEVSGAELRAAVAELDAAKAAGRPPELDVALAQEAQAMTEIGTWSLVDPEGPLWFRGYAQWEEAATAGQVHALLDTLKLTRIVVGHTVMPDRQIRARYGGRVLLIDTGMLTAVYQGTPSALEITGGTLKAIYPDRETVPQASAATPVRAVLTH